MPITAHVQPVRTTGRRFATLVNKSYRRYTLCRTTSVVAYMRQTLVNSDPDLETSYIFL